MSCKSIERREQYDQSAFNNFQVENFVPNSNLADINDAHKKSAEMQQFEAKFAHLTSQVDIYSDNVNNADTMKEKNITSKQVQLNNINNINNRDKIDSHNVINKVTYLTPLSTSTLMPIPAPVPRQLAHTEPIVIRPDPVEDIIGINTHRMIYILSIIILFMIILKFWSN